MSSDGEPAELPKETIWKDCLTLTDSKSPYFKIQGRETTTKERIAKLAKSVLVTVLFSLLCNRFDNHVTQCDFHASDGRFAMTFKYYFVEFDT